MMRLDSDRAAGNAANSINSGPTDMDFIEHWFGVSPDGGNGSLEILWIAAIVVAALAVGFRHRITAYLASRKANPR